MELIAITPLLGIIAMAPSGEAAASALETSGVERLNADQVPTFFTGETTVTNALHAISPGRYLGYMRARQALEENIARNRGGVQASVTTLAKVLREFNGDWNAFRDRVRVGGRKISFFGVKREVVAKVRAALDKKEIVTDSNTASEQGKLLGTMIELLDSISHEAGRKIVPIMVLGNIRAFIDRLEGIEFQGEAANAFRNGLMENKSAQKLLSDGSNLQDKAIELAKEMLARAERKTRDTGSVKSLSEREVRHRNVFSAEASAA